MVGISIEDPFVLRSFAPAFQSALTVVAMTLAGSLWANSVGYSVNSRGVDQDDRRVNALWRVDLSSGEAGYIGWTSFLDVEALALSPDGSLYGADDDSNTLLRISTVTGLAQPVGGAANRFNMGVRLDRKLDFGMSFTCDGEMFLVSDVEQSLFTANLETGRLSLAGEPGSLGVPITDLAVRADEVYGIGVGLTSDGLEASPGLYRIDLEQASATLVGPLGPDVAPYNNAGLSFSEDGTLWAITDRRAVDGQDFPSQILRIDPGTGEAVVEADTIIGLESLAVSGPVLCELRGGPGAATHAIPVLSGPALLALILGMLLVGGLRLRIR